VAGVTAAALAAGGGAALVLLPGSNFGHELDRAPSLGYLAFFTAWEAAYTVSMWLAVLVAFRELANAEGGRAGAAVSVAAYAAYILHVPILTALALGFEAFAWHPVVKCLVVTPLLVACTWALAMLLRCVPGVKRIL
jgi:glucans biosynthesis protein C